MANEHIGRLESIGIAKESAHGTPVSPAFFIPKVSGSMTPVVEKARDTGAYGVIDELRATDTVKKMTETSFSAIVRDDWFGLILLAAFGSVNSSTVSGSVKDHTFTVKQDNDHPSFTLSNVDPVEQDQAPYSMLDELEVDAVTGDFVKITAKFKGKALASTSGLSVSFTAGNDFLTKHCTVKIAPTAAVVAAAASVAVTRFKFTINKNVVDYQAFGDADVNALFNQQWTVKGEFEMLYNSVYYRDVFQDEGDDSKRAIQFKLLNSDVTIGGSYNPTITFTFYKVGLTTWSKSDDNNAIVKQTVGFEAEYSVSDSKTMQAVLRNLTASY